MPARSGAYPESRILRSRTRTGESTGWRSPDPGHIASRETVSSSLGLNWISRLRWRIIQTTPRFRTRSTRVRVFCIMVLTMMFVFSGYMRFERAIIASLAGRDGQMQFHLTNQNGSQSSERARTHQASFPPTAANAALPSLRLPPSRPWKYPLIDRTVLDKLDVMQDFFTQEYGPFHPDSTDPELEPQRNPSPASQLRSPPLITRIPERASRPPTSFGVGGSTGSRSPIALHPEDGSAAICDSAAHPRPCRFLLPLRIAEQESKARMHITQLAVLARRLNRTLVLPNVGKSKIGACFRWPFSVYYDVGSIDFDGTDDWPTDSDADGGEGGGKGKGKESYVDLESFHAWMESYDRRQRRGPLKSQLVSIAPALPPSGLRKEAIYANQDISVYAYSTFGAWEQDLPGCFSSKFQQLRLETRPIFISPSPSPPPKRDGRHTPLRVGASIVDALPSISPGASSEPSVLVVNWDMRYPVFPPLHPNSNSQSLQYSAQMHSLARRYAPAPPYLVVQWRMETVDFKLLHECAHVLVDVLFHVLHDPALSENITTVWFASDYPYPIGRRSKSGSRPPAISAKSGTFRDFNILHEDAIEILRKAFDEQGELNEWRLTDFVEFMENDMKSPNELLHDPGVLGILDKLVSTDAAIFVSGSSRCSRKSSFTKQVVDARNRNWGRRGESHLRNVIDIFG